MRAPWLLTASLVLSLSASTHAHDFFLRANRPFFVGCQLFEFAIFSRAFPWEKPLELGAFRSSESLKRELLSSEEWKFEEFRGRDYMTSDLEKLVGDKVRQVESILLHDEIVILYAWIPTGGAPGVPFREPVALVAGKRLTADPLSTLLLEDHQHIHIDRPVPVRITEAEFGPMHWRLSGVDTSNIKFYRGDLFQINSLVLRRSMGPAWLPYLYTMAYWHGASNTGRMIPAGVKVVIAGVEIEGPALIQPTFYVGEGYGRRAKVFERINFERVPVDGQLVFPDADVDSIKLSLMMADQHRFLIQLPATFSERLSGDDDSIYTTFMGPLSMAQMAHHGHRLPGDSFVSLSHEAEAKISPICVWEVALNGIPQKVGPIESMMEQRPQAHFRRH